MKYPTQRVLDYWKEYYQKHGEWPSLQKAAIDLNYADDTGIRRQLVNLCKEGLLKHAASHYWYI